MTFDLTILWGKAQEGGDYHPLLNHMLDVAAVAYEILEQHLLPPSVERVLLEHFSKQELCFIVALHDLGKASPSFQIKAFDKLGEMILKQADKGLPFDDLTIELQPRHDAVTLYTLPDILEELGAGRHNKSRVTAALSMHHGHMHPWRDIDADDGPEWGRVRKQIVETLADIFDVDVPTLRQDIPPEATILLAGLTIVSDWIGSNASNFIYTPGRQADKAFFEERRPIAQRALLEGGLKPYEKPGLDFRSNFGFARNALQEQVLKHTNLDPDTIPLVILEAPTGGGKTEAAIDLAFRMIRTYDLGGLYMGLPTMATSNAMYGRLKPLLDNLGLHHSQAKIFQEVLDKAYRDNLASSKGKKIYDLKDLRLLRSYGVGTVDQVLKSATAIPRWWLILSESAGKVLILDEVHAYDLYMQNLLGVLLQWLKILGTPVIVLTATLPRSIKQGMLEAWGCRGEVGNVYPSITVASGSAVKSYALLGAEERDIEVAYRHVEDDKDIATEILSLQGCTAWIHNTVKETQEAYKLLKSLGVPSGNLLLFHARFPMRQRQDIEQRLLGLLGPGAERPERLIVIATQVVEQSLDVDFDHMYSEIAPVDLLVQRAGRLHRHQLGGRVGKPVLNVLRHGEGAFFGSTGFVYHPWLLLRTEDVLKKNKNSS